MLVVGSLFQVAVFAVQALALPFPLFVLSFAVGGIGIAIQVSHIGWSDTHLSPVIV